ncbi:MAG: phage portal protein [Clostridia bacterium]|nr:phage portal protein [Clostridia bacterium]
MLRYSKTKLESEEAITRLFAKAQAELDVRKQLYEQFRRKLTDEELASLTDEDIKVPLERYISVMSAGYFGGKAPKYKVKAFNKDRNAIIQGLFDKPTNTEQDIKEIEELISHIVDYNDDGALFLELVLDFLVKRACYEIYYKDKETGEITIARSDALETVAIWDYSLPKNLIGIYRIIQTTMADGQYQNMVELTTAKGKRYYMDTPEKRVLFGTPEYEVKFRDEPLFKEDKKMKQPRKWDNDIPATAIEQEDGLAIFEPVISLIKAYQQVIQNSRNTFKYNDEAILAVIGYQPENEMLILDDNGNKVINPARVKEDEYVLNSRVRYLDGDQGTNSDIKWVTKDVNDNALQNHKKTLMDIICLCSFCPNMTDLGFTSADNNSALEKKFFSLQQYIATFEGEFKKALLRRWEIILNKFNKEKGKTYDFRDIQIELQRNVPTDTASATDTALKLRTLLSDESIINLLPYSLDAQSELDKINEQNANNMKNNLEAMKKLGNNPNKEYEVKEAGDNNANVEVSRPEDNRTKEEVRPDEQTNPA